MWRSVRRASPPPGSAETYLVMHAELEGIICSGPRRGRRQTYALVEERVPPSRPRSRDESLAELAQRYVQGHGPRRLSTFRGGPGSRSGTRGSRWTLPRRRAPGDHRRPGVLRLAVVAGPRGPPDVDGEPIIHLLPNYDELLIAFRDRSDAMDPLLPPPARVAAEILNHIIVRNGLGIGGWRRTDETRVIRVALNPLVPLSDDERAAIRAGGRPPARSSVDRGGDRARLSRARGPCYPPPRRRAASAWWTRRAEIAQLVEHATENRGVASSTLALGTNKTGARSSERKWLSW